MQYTENYNLYKPVYGEPADVADLNHNADEIDSLIHDNRTMIAPTFDPAKAYVTDDPVEYQGKLYVFAADKAAGAWDSSKVRRTTAAEIGGGGASALADLTDVDLSTPTDGQVLVYDGTAGKWENATLPTPTVPDELNDMSDVDITTPTDGQILVYDDTDDEWKNADIPDPSVTAEATGNPITLTDAADAPMVECKATITPKQDLHGYDKPWVGGAGKNKLQNNSVSGTVNNVTFTVNDDGSISLSGTATAKTDRYLYGSVSTYVSIGIASGSYKMTGASGTGIGLFLVSNSGTSKSQYGLDDVSVTIDDTDTYRMFFRIDSGTDTTGITLKPMIRPLDTSKTYEPYSNICPITGMDEVNIERVSSVNLCPTNATISGYGVDPSGNVVEYATFGVWDADVIPGQYTINLKDSHTSSNKILRIVYGDTEPYIVLQSIQYLYASNVFPVTFTVPSGVKHIRLSIREASASEIMLQRGSTSTPYVPYDSTNPPAQYTIQLGDTYYGGTVDAVRGVLIVDKVGRIFTGGISENWDAAGTSSYGARYAITLSDAYVESSQRNSVHMCNEGYYSGSANAVGVTFIYGVTKKLYYYPPLLYTDPVSTFKSWLSNNSLQVVYTLATPLEIPLTPTLIRTLLGNNIIWTDGDSMDIEYITKPYEPLIKATNVSIEEHGKTIESIITENLEPRMVASRNYTIGELIISGDKAYRATANIASGATLTVGTNVAATTIEDEIGRSGHVYSTTEQVVGTWTDGSTLYEKTVSVTLPNSSGDTMFPVSTTGLTKVIEWNLYNSTKGRPAYIYCPWYAQAEVSIESISDTEVWLYLGGTYNAGDVIYITFKYMK